MDDGQLYCSAIGQGGADDEVFIVVFAQYHIVTTELGWGICEEWRSQ